METRLSRRFRKKTKINFKINKNSAASVIALKDKTLEADLYDISVLGIGIITDYYLPKGITLDITLKGSDFGCQDDLFLNGEVRHSKSVLLFGYKANEDKETKTYKYIKRSAYQSGIKFLNITPEQKKLIENSIARAERRKKDRLKIAE